jgi:hypothetical protein
MARLPPDFIRGFVGLSAGRTRDIHQGGGQRQRQSNCVLPQLRHIRLFTASRRGWLLRTARGLPDGARRAGALGTALVRLVTELGGGNSVDPQAPTGAKTSAGRGIDCGGKMPTAHNASLNRRSEDGPRKACAPMRQGPTTKRYTAWVTRQDLIARPELRHRAVSCFPAR